MGQNKWRIVMLAVTVALERHDPQRELTSRLISDLYGQVVSMDDMIRGFDGLLADIDDLTLDTPDAPKVIRRNFCPNLFMSPILFYNLDINGKDIK